MDKLEIAETMLADSCSLPQRRGKRPTTIRGPLHLQCDDHGSPRQLRQLVEQIVSWSGIEVNPSLDADTDLLLSFRVGEDVASGDRSAFIIGREFGRVLFGSPTIYLCLPLIYAHWAIVRGWGEPHFSSSFGFIPPGVMVIYTPRDEQELIVCQGLFWASYTFSLRNDRRNRPSAKPTTFADGNLSPADPSQ